MPKVLLIEDSKFFSELIKLDLENGGVEVLLSMTLDGGYELFCKHSDIDLIMIDACVPGDRPNSMPLVQRIVAGGYNKPIIACSSMPKYSRELISVGATHMADKNEAATMALHLLNIKLSNHEN